MTAPEMLIVSLVYVATLLLAQRAFAFLLPDFQEIAFVVATLAGAVVAGVLFHRREKRRASKLVVFSVGATMAVLGVVVGELSQLLWQPFNFPSISIPAAAVVTILLSFAIFPIGRPLTGEGREAVDPMGLLHVILVGVVAIGAGVFAVLLPAPGHSTLKLVPQTFPGLTIALPPDWQAEEKSTQSDAGTIRLADPAGGDHFLSVRWTDSDNVLPDDYIKVISAGTLEVKERVPALVSGHEGATFQLTPPGKPDDLHIATIWYCPPDHRVMWITTHLLQPRASMLATHQRVVESVHCHTGEGKPTTAAAASERVFPQFVPPPGYGRDPNPDLMRFIGPRRETIVFDAAVAGRSALVDTAVSPENFANRLKGIGLLVSIEGTPQERTVNDLLGHTRRVWSAKGAASDGTRVQVEVMVWWCDRRDMTFIGTYAAQGSHDASEGINALLPAVCHTGQ
jgi:hypothetical protein